MVLFFMNFNEYKSIDLSTALTLADEILASRSPKANFLLNMGVSKSRGQYLKLCFSYLRWVDDIVDDPKVKVSYKRKFINRQLNLISNYSNNILSPIEDTAEAFLHYFIQYGLNKGKNIIIDSVRLMIEGLEMDVQRTERDGIFSEAEMSTYINKMSKSFFDVTASFILPEGKYPYQDVIVTTASTKILMIRDLVEDFEAGYINIAKENLYFYNLDQHSFLQSNHLKAYLIDEIEKIIQLLLSEANIIKQFPLRLKLFNYYTQIYYLPLIFRVIACDYNLKKITEKRVFKSEIITYFLSIKLSFRLFIREFLLLKLNLEMLSNNAW